MDIIDHMTVHLPFSAHGLFFLSGGWINGSACSFSWMNRLSLESEWSTIVIIDEFHWNSSITFEKILETWSQQHNRVRSCHFFHTSCLVWSFVVECSLTIVGFTYSWSVFFDGDTFAMRTSSRTESICFCDELLLAMCSFVVSFSSTYRVCRSFVFFLLFLVFDENQLPKFYFSSSRTRSWETSERRQ
jgi:hypothetical protein